MRSTFEKNPRAFLDSAANRLLVVASGPDTRLGDAGSGADTGSAADAGSGADTGGGATEDAGTESDSGGGGKAW